MAFNPLRVFMAQPAQPATTPPHKAAKSTGYTATGMVPQATGSDLETGSSQYARILEIVPELATPYIRSLTYNKMMNDAGVDASMRIVKTPVLGSEMFMEPHGDSPQDALIAEFVWDNLTGGLAAPLINSMEDILHFFEDGYSVLEEVYENRAWAPKASGANSKIYTMLKKFGVRPATTISQINYDNNGGPVNLVQQAIQADRSVKEVTMDISKCLIFTFNRKGGDLTGKSLLRTAHPHWFYKNHLYKIDAVQKERHALGVPRGKLLPGYSQKDKEILRQLLSNIRTNEEAFFIQTPNVEIDFAEIKGSLVSPLDSAHHHNMMIFLNVLAAFLVLGVEGAGGGRATAGAQSDLFMKALKYCANYIADMINMYTIPKLVVWNFPTNNFPKLRVRNVGETRDLQMLASAIANLFAQGAVIPDDPTEEWVRRQFDMPRRDPSTARDPANQPQQDPFGGGGGNGAPPPPGGKANGKGEKGNIKQPADKVGGNTGKPPAAPE